MLRATLKLSAQKIAVNVGLNRGTVEQIIARYFKGGAKTLVGGGSGGRRHAYLSTEDEKLFIKRFIPKASEGGIIVVNEIVREFEELVERKVSESTVYRLLARHGWRKIAPRPKHPKADRTKQTEFKKKSPDKN
jgi:transposase